MAPAQTYSSLVSPRGSRKVLDNFDPVGTVFSEFTGMAIKHGAVNLGQGFPTVGVPQFVRDAAVGSVEADTLLHQYARSEGNPELVKALARFYADKLPPLDPMSEIITTVGATEAIFSTLMAFVSPGDRVVLMSPHYDSYPASVIMAGGEPAFVRMRPKVEAPRTSDEWEVDWEQLEGMLEEDRREGEKTGRRRIRVMMVNNPHNPLGKVWTRPELERLASLCVSHDLLLISDDVYEALVYSDSPGPMVKAASLPGMWERTVSLGSIGKTFGVTGWKIGWAVGPKELIRTIWLVHQWVPFAIVNPLQEASARAFNKALDEGFLPRQAAQYESLRDQLAAMLRTAGLEPCVPHGGYFIMASTETLRDPAEVEPWASMDEYQSEARRDFRIARWMTKEAGVTAIPPSPFVDKEDGEAGREMGRWVRFAFCKDAKMIDEAGKRLLEHLPKLRR
ncbi:pyridoxal phosphate-dependent transferase [Hyaloraphidium curvatum]|nr:pyridoxal phosphate-dependent transferase [Hyaloraphidium curvatum]